MTLLTQERVKIRMCPSTLDMILNCMQFHKEILKDNDLSSIVESRWTVSVGVISFGIKTCFPLRVCGPFISDRLDVSPCLPVKRHLSTTIYQSNGYY